MLFGHGHIHIKIIIQFSRYLRINTFTLQRIYIAHVFALLFSTRILCRDINNITKLRGCRRRLTNLGGGQKRTAELRGVRLNSANNCTAWLGGSLQISLWQAVSLPQLHRMLAFMERMNHNALQMIHDSMKGNANKFPFQFHSFDEIYVSDGMIVISYIHIIGTKISTFARNTIFLSQFVWRGWGYGSRKH